MRRGRGEWREVYTDDRLAAFSGMPHPDLLAPPGPRRTMHADLQQIAEAVRAHLATELGLSGPAAAFDTDRPLISSGVVDSVVIARLISYLEDQYPVEFMAFELDVEYLDTVDRIARTVHDKLEQAR
jgi:acyl carrier protein